MFVGMRSLGWSVGSLESISAARGAAAGVYDIIDAVSRTNIVKITLYLNSEPENRIYF
jgi:hypothetical protein